MTSRTRAAEVGKPPCITRVLEGEPEHRDFYLSDAENARNDQFTPCCSRARSAVRVLDL